MANPEINPACLPPQIDYFASREGSWETAVSKIDKLLDPKTDTDTLGVWLLTQIDHWDHEMERIIVVTNYSLYIIKFNFIALQVHSHQRIPLSLIKRVTIGDLSYPCRSLSPGRCVQGIKLEWETECPVTNAQLWNPWAEMPEVLLMSHPLLLYPPPELEDYEGEGPPPELEMERFNVVDFAQKVLQAIESAPDREDKVRLCKSPICIRTYFGLLSMVFNAHEFGFFKSRVGTMAF